MCMNEISEKTCSSSRFLSHKGDVKRKCDPQTCTRGKLTAVSSGISRNFY